MKPFMFCPLELSGKSENSVLGVAVDTELLTTDDDDLLHTTGSAEKLGMIELKFRFVTVCNSRDSYVPWSTDQSEGFSNGPVHERAKKLASHRVG